MIETAGVSLRRLVDIFARQLLPVLQRYPDGISEYELIMVLRQCDAPADWLLFDSDDRLALFRCHFLLFSALYRLQAQLDGQVLEISPLSIHLRPLGAGERNLPLHADPLRAYYLDTAHLERMDSAGVDALLDNFWLRLSATDGLAEAMAVLGLRVSDNYETARQAYKRLSMRHHPDRGGDVERMLELQQAMTVVANHFGRRR